MPGATIEVKATYLRDTRRFHVYTLDMGDSGIVPETLYVPKNGEIPAKVIITLATAKPNV